MSRMGGFFSPDDPDENSVLSRLNKAAGAYVLAKAFIGVGKSWYSRGRDATTYRISVYGGDDIYSDLHTFILDNTPPRKQRDLVARSSTTSDSDDDCSPIEAEGYGVSYRKKKRARVVLAYKGDREQTLTIEGHRIKVSVEVPQISGDPEKWHLFTKKMERVILTASSVAGRDAVYRLLEEMLQKRNEQPHISVVKIVNRWGDWNTRNDLPHRPLGTVVLRQGQAERMVADLTEFLVREQDYNRRSMPWHRGYLLHGPPGTGKTSMAWAMAHHFNLDLWYMPLADIERDQDLISLVSRVSPRSILLLEDIDVFHAARDRDDGQGLSLSGLLNSLDGIATPHGLITFMTTNDLSVLDDALVRPGRVDVIEEIRLLDNEQATRLLQLFYPQVTNREATRVGRLCTGRSPAAVLEVCKRYLDDPKQALKELASA